MSDFSENLKEALYRLGFTQSQLAERLGISQGAVANWVNGRRQPKLNDIQNISKILGVDLLAPTINGDGEFSFDVLDVQVSAGNGLAILDENVIQSISISKERFRDLFRKEPTTSMKIINAKGDSMSPTFKDNDFLLVDTANTTIADGVFVFRIADELYVKRLQRLPAKILALSDNNKYQPFDLPEESVLIARVIDVWRHDFI